MMTRKSAVASGSVWFEHLSTDNAPLLRLFCLPYAGGTADLYRGWQRWFPEQIDLCLVHLPGRGRRFRERPFTRVTSVVNAIANHLPPLTGVPYALYGHSMGAIISFELSRELFRRGVGPRRLFVSGNRAPQFPTAEPITYNLPHDGFIAELKRLNGTPQEVLDSPEMMELFMDVLRADFELVQTYEYGPGEPLACPLTVYGALNDQRVPVESCFAWQDQTSAECTVRIFQGDHFFVRDPSPEFTSAFRNDVLSAAASSPAKAI